MLYYVTEASGEVENCSPELPGELDLSGIDDDEIEKVSPNALC